MKKRCDSLFAKLKPQQREELLHALIEDCVSTEKSLRMCEDWGVKASRSGLSRFLSSHGLPWRLERAKAAAEASSQSLPTNWEAQKRRGLQQKEYELAFSNLTAKELVAMKRLELKAEELKLAREKFEELKARNVAASEKLKSAVTRGGIAPETLRTIEEAIRLL